MTVQSVELRLTPRHIEPSPSLWGRCNRAIGLPYENILAETFRLASVRVGDDHCSLAQLIIPLRGYGTLSFASAYREVRIGMTWDEWQQLQRRQGVQCVCDATSCYVDDLLRTYNVTFRNGEGEPLRVYSKQAYVHFPIRPSWKLLHR